MKILGIIPVRMHSTRLPQKPVAEIKGKPMLQHVWESAIQSKLVDKWIVATPDESLRNLCVQMGAECVITSNLHRSGTDRCAEALVKMPDHYDAVINLQGDEPMIQSSQIDSLASGVNPDTQIATLMRKSKDMQEIENSNTAKVTFRSDKNAMYFSRYPIPYFREDDEDRFAWIHTGMYFYTSNVLEKLAQLPIGDFESIEELEQLRWLEAGYNILCIETDIKNYGVDTEEDLDFVKKKMNDA